MGLIADNKGGSTNVPEGTHLAICTKVIDLGTQRSELYGPRHKVFIAWELPEVMAEYDGEQRPAGVGQQYTVSLHEKSNLHKLLVGWRGRKFTPEEEAGFHLKNILGVPCLLSIVHSSDGKYANVQSAVKLPTNTGVPEPVNNLVYYEIEQGKDDVYRSLSEKMQLRIADCAEWNAQPNEDIPPPTDDDIPF